MALILIIVNRLNNRQVTKPKAQTIGPTCLANGATCSWDYTGSDEVTFDYAIKDITQGDTPTASIIKKGQTPATSVSFTPQPNHIYKCTVFAINSCGSGPAGSAQNICLSGLSPTPTTPPKTPTPTPTTPPGVTPTVTPTKTPTPTPTKTPTPSPTLPPGVTPTATPTPSPTTPQSTVVTPTRTPTPTEIIIVVQTTTVPKSTSAPTTTTVKPPTAGSLWPSVAVIGFSLAIIALGLVL